MTRQSNDGGQATVEFALLMPFFVLLVACILGTTVACLQVLRTDDTARTAARLASVSADPPGTARDWVAGVDPRARVDASTNGDILRVRVTRTVGWRIPFLPRAVLGFPFTALAVTALEPPSPGATSVDP